MNQSDSESIASLETESETESVVVETKTKSKSKIVKPAAVEVAISAKTGKPKRIMTESQKEGLAKARVLARARRKELKELKDQEKAIKKDNFLIKKLEMEAKVKEHKERLRVLAINAGYVEKEPNERAKKYKPRDHLKDDDHDRFQQAEIEKLEEQLNTLKDKSNPVKNPKKVKAANLVPQESESEDESEEEPEPVKEKKEKKEKRSNPPIVNMEKDKTRKGPKSAIPENKVDPKMQAMLNSLFPNYRGT